jgi:hypothetical protein
MATSKIITILVVALIAAFFVLTLIPTSYIPYSKGPNYARYENFAEGAFGAEGEFGAEGAFGTEEDEKAKEDEGLKNLEGIEDAEEAEKSKNSNEMMPSMTGENFKPIMEVPKTIQYGELRDSEIINKFSQTASTGMHGVSSGIAKCEGGSVCLSPELIQLLKTRGGNASGN